MPRNDARWMMPAEWEPHEAMWLAWPHNASDWPGKLAAIHWVYAEIVRKLAPSETVRILVNDHKHETRARRYLHRAGADLSRVIFHRFATDRGWARDFGPMFVRPARPSASRPSLAVLDGHFNAWAKYPQYHRDKEIAGKAAHALGLPLVEAAVNGRAFVLEGGAIDVNGQGTLITTEECLLDQDEQPRNPGLDRRTIEAALRRFIGAEQVVWLGRGVAGDDTHGHVDDVCRFVAPDTVVLCREDDPSDTNHDALADNRRRLSKVKLANGKRLRVVDLPMPEPLFFDGHRLPASYANFVIANKVVLAPTFHDPRDRDALRILAELFPSRQVVGIHAVDLVWGFGTLHCMSQQQPKP